MIEFLQNYKQWPTVNGLPKNGDSLGCIAKLTEPRHSLTPTETERPNTGSGSEKYRNVLG